MTYTQTVFFFGWKVEDISSKGSVAWASRFEGKLLFCGNLFWRNVFQFYAVQVCSGVKQGNEKSRYFWKYFTVMYWVPSKLTEWYLHIDKVINDDRINVLIKSTRSINSILLNILQILCASRQSKILACKNFH